MTKTPMNRQDALSTLIGISQAGIELDEVVVVQRESRNLRTLGFIDNLMDLNQLIDFIEENTDGDTVEIGGSTLIDIELVKKGHGFYGR